MYKSNGTQKTYLQNHIKNISSSVSACPQHIWELPWALGGLTRTARVLALRAGHALTAAGRASPYIDSRRR